MAKLDPLGPSLQNFPRQSHIFKAKLWFSLKVRALHKKIFTRPSILPKRHWTKTSETVSLKEKGPKTPWDVMGVKTTCLEAPGVSLGGSGVSIGGFRILRGEQMYCEGLALRIFAYPACSYKSIALRIFKTSHFEYSHLEYSRPQPSTKQKVRVGLPFGPVWVFCRVCWFSASFHLFLPSHLFTAVSMNLMNLSQLLHIQMQTFLHCSGRAQQRM